MCPFRFGHLWENLALQMMFGVPLEIIHGWKRTMIVYISSALGGMFFLSLYNPEQYAVGSTAAIHGMVFAYLTSVILNDQIDHKYSRLSLVLLFITFDVASNFSLVDEKLHVSVVHKLIYNRFIIEGIIKFLFHK